MKRFLCLLLALLLCLGLCACRQADKVNHNLSKEANNFGCERRITVYNARTDRIIFQAEGYLALSNNLTNELVVTFKTGEQQYKKNYIYLNEYTMYIVEDITGSHSDPYHYRWEFHVLPQFAVDVVP